MAYKWITSTTSPNRTASASVAAVFGIARNIKGFTYHHWGDPANRPTFEGVVSWLSRPNGNTSAHTVVEGSPQRRVACIVPFYDASWAGGTALANATQIHIECNPQATDADYDVVAEHSADLMSAFGDQLKYGHNNWIATQCPGRYDINRIDRESYKKFSAAEWGKGGDIKTNTPPVVVTPPVAPTPTPVADPEWVRNLKDITDTKLIVLPADGIRRINLVTLQVVNDVIPKGTWIDIAKETTIGGKKFYISSSSAKSNAAIGLEASGLGLPSINPVPPVEDKPEWLKNLVDIEDKDMWTRSETPVLNLIDGKTVKTLPINTKVRISHATKMVDLDLLMLDGTKMVIETLYLSDKPIVDPYEDIQKRLTALEAFKKLVMDFLSSIFTNFNKGK